MGRRSSANTQREQLSLPFATQDRPPLPVGMRKPTPRCAYQDKIWFGIFPDHDARARIAGLVARLRGEYGLRAPPTAPERLHVSVHGVGAYADPPPEIIAAAERAGAAIEGPSFEVAFDRVLSFKNPGRLPLVLAGGDGLAALTAVRKALGAEMRRAGVSQCVPSGGEPHLTLLYVDRVIREMKIESIRWVVRELVLVRTLYGRGRHIHLATWPLSLTAGRAQRPQGAAPLRQPPLPYGRVSTSRR